jgi:tetratricopeptide (TPR) repeat protein
LRSRHGTWRRGSLRIAAIVLAMLAACGREAPPEAKPTVPGAADYAELDRGVGLMGKFEFAQARDTFAKLAERYPAWNTARFDLAIALLNRQQDGDERAAAEMLRALVRDEPGNLNAVYALALLALHGGAAADAQPLFRRVVDADGRDAYARYFLAQSLLAQDRPAAALPLFQEAATLDPRLRSARYGASQALARLGRTKEAAAMLAAFEAEKNNPLARLAEFKYTRMGARALAIGSPVSPAASAPPAGALFAAPVQLLASNTRANPGAIASAADIDGDGEVDLLLSQAFGNPAPVLLAKAGEYVLQPEHDLTLHGGADFAAWGDIDNDGLLDVLLCDARNAPRIMSQSPRGKWKARDVPVLAKIGGTRDCQLVDADHDGDLDILLVTTKGERLIIANNGDGTFRNLADRLPKPTSNSPAVQILAVDIDDDHDLDLVVLHAGGPHEVLANERLWVWKPATGFDAFVREAAIAVVTARDGNGMTHLVTLTPELAIRDWKRGEDGQWKADTLVAAQGTPARDRRAQLAMIDVDGDGRPEILASTPRGLAVWRWSAGESRPLFAIEDDSLVSWTVAALDAKGPSLITYHRDGTVNLRKPGPGRHAFAWISLTGGEAKESAVRSNRSGIGARVTGHAQDRTSQDETLRHDSGPGQSLTPVALGLAGGTRLDYLTIDWSDGVFQSEVALEGAKLHRIAETQRQLSSCPLIFAWDGKRFAFVSDFLGVGGIGFLLKPGEYVTPRPWENFLFPAGAIAPLEGRIAIKIGEPMEEAAYVDSVELVVHDLPAGWDMALDERMETGGPRVTGRAFYYRREATASRATNERGADITQALRTVDLEAADPGAHDARFIGRLAGEHVITLEFEEEIAAGPGLPILVVDGWIEYPYAQTMFAAWQANAQYHTPTLEARGADGRWRTVLREFGYPAGMPRRSAMPLPALPRGTRALRLRTNQEIYFDRIAVAWAEGAPVAAKSLRLAKAIAGHSGFPRSTKGAQQQPAYDYDHRAPLWDTRTQSGFYTAFGAVDELVAAHDDALAIIGPGEELHLEFEALPAPAPGIVRRYELRTHGWAKDMDLYTRDGETIGPLPVTGKDPRVARLLHGRYNTRFAEGR